VPTLWRLVHFVLGAWLTAWLLLWRVAEPCWGRGGRVSDTAACPVIVGKRQPQWQGLTPSIPPFTVRRYFTMKEVRLHSNRSGWNSCRHALLQHGGYGARHIGWMAAVCWKPGPETEVWARRCLCPSPGGRARRSLAPETKGSGETELAPEAKGSGETELTPEPWEVLSAHLIPFCDFYSLHLGIPFYGTQQDSFFVWFGNLPLE
jgi:hypothetical protein